MGTFGANEAIKNSEFTIQMNTFWSIVLSSKCYCHSTFALKWNCFGSIRIHGLRTRRIWIFCNSLLKESRAAEGKGEIVGRLWKGASCSSRLTCCSGGWDPPRVGDPLSQPPQQQGIEVIIGISNNRKSWCELNNGSEVAVNWSNESFGLSNSWFCELNFSRFPPSQAFGSFHSKVPIFSTKKARINGLYGTMQSLCQPVVCPIGVLRMV